MVSDDAMNQILTLRRRLKDFLGEYKGIEVTAAWPAPMPNRPTSAS